MATPPRKDFEDLEDEALDLPDLFRDERIRRSREAQAKKPRSYSRDKGMDSIKKVEDTQKQVKKRLYQTAQEAKDPGMFDRAWEGIKEGAKSAAGTPLGQAVIGGAALGMEAIDYVDRKSVREPEAKLLGIDPRLARDSNEFHSITKKRAQAGDSKAQNYQRFKNATSLGVAPIADALGADGVADFARDFSHDAGISPWNFVGMAPPKAAAMKASSRLLRGISKEAREKALANISKHLSEDFSPALFGKVAEELRAVGAQQEDIARALGANGERLGRSQLKVGIGDKFSVNPIPEIAQKVTGKKGAGEFPASKVIDKLGDRAQKFRVARGVKAGVEAGGVPLYAPSSPKVGETITQENQRLRFAEQASRGARATAANVRVARHGLIKEAAEAAKPLDDATFQRIAQSVANGTPPQINNAAEALFAQKLAQVPRNAINLAGTSFRNAGQMPATTDDLFSNLARFAKREGDKAGHNQLAAELRIFEGVGQNGRLSPEAAAFLKSRSTWNSTRDVMATGQGSVLNSMGLILDDFNRAWKERMLPGFPGYWLRNFAEDASKMHNAGFNDPRLFREYDNVVKAAAAGDPQAVARLDRARAMGIVQDATLKAEDSATASVDRAAEDLAKSAGRKYGSLGHRVATGVGSVGGLVDKAPAALLVNRKAGDWWDARSRFALFEDGLRKGLAPQQAAERVTQVLLDYGRRMGSHDRFVRRVINFPAYASQAPVSGARLLMENPNRARIQLAAARSAQPYPTEDLEGAEAPKFQQERGPTFRAPGPVRDLVRKVIPGEPNVTYNAPVGAVADIGEALTLATALGSGDPTGIAAPFIRQTTPGIQATFELGTGRDLLTNAKVKDPWSQLASRHLFNVTAPLPRLAGPLIDAGANAMFPEQLPSRFSGAYTEVDPNADLTIPKLLLSLPGLNIRTPDNSQAARNLLDSPEYRRILDELDSSSENISRRKAKRKYAQ